ncbi:MAG: Membrane-bound lytic murein transglycosylase D [Candidatus Ordinivivax streblomastigis]|uniref:Membrane-bound lytic murein transglycosylase D n=1 Tax=Candidatus Ordinivivax streblomastigis TaxID=2540710 RepID=A0A5M8P0C4_9BACT|nr:MAG: Membrane-bound lytic murein transglycosylase D [Candidatus Ordinivivax streblomastigis]
MYIRSKHLFVFLSLLLPTLVCLILFSAGQKADDESLEQPMVSAAVVSLPVPLKIEFCGDTISLRRLDMRERFDREINAMTYWHSTTMLYMKRANRYFPIIEPILKKNGVPDDFKYLAVIESGLENRVVSPASAAGLWQMLEGTAKEMGLEVRSDVDERYNVEKATEAACRYLKTANSRFGNWATAAASYNCGMARISNELQFQQVKSAFDLWLPEETSRYVFRIMAMKTIMTNPKKYGFVLKKEDLYPPVKLDYVEVVNEIPDLAAFAREHGILYRQLKEQNLWLSGKQLTLPKGEKRTYRIAIPTDFATFAPESIEN